MNELCRRRVAEPESREDVTGSAGARVAVGGMLVAVAATLCWTVGSLYARTAPCPGRPCSAAACSKWSAAG